MALYDKNHPVEYYKNMLKQQYTFSDDSFTQGFPYWIKIDEENTAKKLLPNRNKSGYSYGKRATKLSEDGVYTLFEGYSNDKRTAYFITCELCDDNGNILPIELSIPIDLIVKNIEDFSAQVSETVTIIPLHLGGDDGVSTITNE